MSITAAAPPQSVPVFGGFDYVTVDAAHRRVYAAHGGSKALLIVDADSGKIAGQVRVGGMRGVAFDPVSGHVYTGNGDDKSVSEVDPETQKVLRSVDVEGSVDAIALDAALNRLYVDEDNGNRIFVIDTKTFKVVGTVALPGHKPEYLAVDPKSHDVYQNIADSAEIVVIDPATLKVKKTIQTPEIKNNHPLQYDSEFGAIVLAGNGVMSVYGRDGAKKFTVEGVKRFDQCDLDASSHMLACAGGGGISVYRIAKDSTPELVAEIAVAPGVHTVAIDSKTKNIWAVWASQDGTGDYVQRFTLTP
ncbi:MAG: hypothetical protein NVSMB64_13730 [Candidatus Velthaea sp.]